jgi:hypothetical protein
MGRRVHKPISASALVGASGIVDTDIASIFVTKAKVVFQNMIKNTPAQRLPIAFLGIVIFPRKKFKTIDDSLNEFP